MQSHFLTLAVFDFTHVKFRCGLLLVNLMIGAGLLVPAELSCDAKVTSP